MVAEQQRSKATATPRDPAAKATIDEVKDDVESEEVDKRELQEMINEVAVVENVMIALPEHISVTTRKLLDTDTAEELNENGFVNTTPFQGT